MSSRITFSSSLAEPLFLRSLTLVKTSFSWAHVCLAAPGISSYFPGGSCSPYNGKLPSFVSFSGTKRDNAGVVITELGVEGGVATMAAVVAAVAFDGAACFTRFFT